MIMLNQPVLVLDIALKLQDDMVLRTIVGFFFIPVS